MEAARWSSLVDVQSSFNSADNVKGLVVLNVGGNNFRVVAEFFDKGGIVRIAKVRTHAEYDG